MSRIPMLLCFSALRETWHSRRSSRLSRRWSRPAGSTCRSSVWQGPENLEEFRARARESLEKHGGIDPAAFEKLSGLLRYVRGDYNDPTTFQSIRKEIAEARTPTFYLAIP